jgi:hypothetical protein
MVVQERLEWNGRGNIWRKTLSEYCLGKSFVEHSLLEMDMKMMLRL